MSTTTLVTSEHKPLSPAENVKNIENHKRAASHLTEASAHHIDAAKHHETGHHDKAAISSILANGHLQLANEARKEDEKHHATSR